MHNLTPAQLEWLAMEQDKEERMRFLINGPVEAWPLQGEKNTPHELRYVGTLRGVAVTKPVRSMALALKEAEQIRTEYIQVVGMIPLDEDALGIADATPQEAAA